MEGRTGPAEPHAVGMGHTERRPPADKRAVPANSGAAASVCRYFLRSAVPARPDAACPVARDTRSGTHPNSVLCQAMAGTAAIIVAGSREVRPHDAVFRVPDRTINGAGRFRTARRGDAR